MDFELLTKDEAARLARISGRYLQMRILNGTGPDLTKIGRRVFVRTDSLQQWLEKCRVPAGPDPSTAATGRLPCQVTCSSGSITKRRSE